MQSESTVTGRTNHHDRSTIETVEKLIATYKREFGDYWEKAFSETVTVLIPRQP